MEYSDTITDKKGLFERLMGRTKVSGVVAANQVISLWGTQGGVGVSSVTTILAKMLNRLGFTVLVIEATSSGGSLLRLFAKKPVAEGLDTINRNKDKLNGELDSIKINVIKGLSVLPRSGAPYNSQWTWQEAEVRELLRIARKMAGFVLVDVGNNLNDALSRTALMEADHIVSIFRPTLVGLDSATRFHEHCKYGNLTGKLIWLANQAHQKRDVAHLENLLEQKIEYCIPWNKNMDIIEYGDAVPRNIQIIMEELLQKMISAPSARVF